MPGCSFVSGPVIEVTPSGVKITWEASCVSGGQVLIGPNEHELKTLVYDGFVDKSHSIEIRNLQPGKTYFYRVSNMDEDGTPLLQSKIDKFTVL